MPRPFDEHPYGALAWAYDALAGLYSFGAIARSKSAGIEALFPGERVLFAGVGTGREALEAVRRGVRVTAVELAPAMLARFERSLRLEGRSAELIAGDVAAHRPSAPYDAVVAHYFLNLWGSERAARMLALLVERLRPGGRVVLADFDRGEGGVLARAVAATYYRPINVIAAALGFCALHPILDYDALCASAGLRIVSRRRFPVVPGCPNPAYGTIVAERIDAHPSTR